MIGWTRAVSNYDLFINRVLSSEGGYTNHREDPGNWTKGYEGGGVLKGTKWGISAASYPDLDIVNLTREQAIAIYREDFWNRVGGDMLPTGFAFQALDAAVNHGIGNAVRWMQRAAGVADDGKIGPVTKAAIRAQNSFDLVFKFNAERLRFYTKLQKWNVFGKGWTNRVADNLDYAAEDN
jgi:lysozyme family protein